MAVRESMRIGEVILPGQAAMTVKQLTPADLRADIARYDLQQKDIAERAHLHPNHLSGVLKGSRNLTARTAADIARAIAELIAERGAEAPGV